MELTITVRKSDVTGKGGFRYYPLCETSKSLIELMKRKSLVKEDFEKIYALANSMGIILKINKREWNHEKTD